MKSPERIRQSIRYVRLPDGTRLAWADAGSGSPVIKAANWLTHLEYEWESPVWKHWIRFFSTHWRFVRYDERGCGMSGPQLGELTVSQWAADLESVIDAARPAGPVTLLGISQGGAACIQYAIRYPERVARIILYGAYARGGARRAAVHRCWVRSIRPWWT
jgi:pimeloyl-ACP methyl ester carboxylesterase